MLAVKRKPLVSVFISLAALAATTSADGFFLRTTPCTEGEDKPCGECGTCQTGSRKCECPSSQACTAMADTCVSVIFPSRDNKSYADDGFCLTRPSFTYCTIKRARCHGTVHYPQCNCPEDMFFYSDQTCVPAAFPAPSECTEPQKSCSDGRGVCLTKSVCTCKKGYFANLNRCAKHTFVPADGSCQNRNHRDCSEGGKPATCLNNGTCTCHMLAGGHGGFLVALGEKCVSYVAPDNKHCRGNTSVPCGYGAERGRCSRDYYHCTCDRGFIARGSMCVANDFPLPECPVGELCSGNKGRCLQEGVCTCYGENFVKGNHCVSSFFNSTDCINSTSQGKTTCSGLGECLSGQRSGVCQCLGESWVDGDPPACVSPTFFSATCTVGQICSGGDGKCVMQYGKIMCRCNDNLFSVAGKTYCRKLPSILTKLGRIIAKSSAITQTRPDPHRLVTSTAAAILCLVLLILLHIL